MADTFDLGDTYKALKVFTTNETLRGIVGILDPKGLEQADKAVSGFENVIAQIEAEKEPNPEWVVDLYIPFSCVPPDAESAEEAEAMARAAFISEGLYDVLLTALGDDTVFYRSDSEWRTEVGC